MDPKAQEIARRTQAALNAIKAQLDEPNFSVDLFVSHHLEEVEATYWEKHSGTSNPTPEQLVEVLELRSAWEEEAEEDLETFDFTLPGDVTDYVLAVSFDENGEVEEISMES